MSYDNEWLNQTLEARAKSVRESIRPVSVEELKRLGSERFSSVSDPWAESYKAFLEEHAKDRFYLATTHEGAEIVYSREASKAIWFLPGRGMGPVQERGIKILADAVAAL